VATEQLFHNVTHVRQGRIPTHQERPPALCARLAKLDWPTPMLQHALFALRVRSQ